VRRLGAAQGWKTAGSSQEAGTQAGGYWVQGLQSDRLPGREEAHARDVQPRVCAAVARGRKRRPLRLASCARAGARLSRAAAAGRPSLVFLLPRSSPPTPPSLRLLPLPFFGSPLLALGPVQTVKHLDDFTLEAHAPSLPAGRPSPTRVSTRPLDPSGRPQSLPDPLRPPRPGIFHLATQRSLARPRLSVRSAHRPLPCPGSHRWSRTAAQPPPPPRIREEEARGPEEAARPPPWHRPRLEAGLAPTRASLSSSSRRRRRCRPCRRRHRQPGAPSRPAAPSSSSSSTARPQVARTTNGPRRRRASRAPTRRRPKARTTRLVARRRAALAISLASSSSSSSSLHRASRLRSPTRSR
jgi:hypothetical protein